MPTKKPTKGQPLNIAARDWSRMLDMASEYDQRKLGVAVPPSSGDPPVYAKNSSGSDVAMLGAMGISGIAFTPTESEPDFDAARFIVDTTTPVRGTYAGKFAIAAEPIPDGEIGRVWMSGVCPCLLEIDKDWHRYCDVKSSAAELLSYPGGGAEILWKESGTGTGKRAIIRFGPIPFVSAQFDIDSAMATTDSTEGADLNNCTVPGYDGNNVTLYNHDESGGDYIFEGDAGDKGTCWYSVSEDKWYISQMECP